MTPLHFIAIDFETATNQRTSICEVGLCIVRHSEIVETKSWLVQPENNFYHYWNTRIHGISPRDTADAPSFPTVWTEIQEQYLGEFRTFVAHNMPFDRSCLEQTAILHGISLPSLQWKCSLKIARQLYGFKHNSLGTLCEQLGIERGIHHRAGSDAEMCAKLYLTEQADAPPQKQFLFYNI